MAQLKVEGVSKSFDGEPVIRDISIELHKGELVSLLGISGGGKTTLFNIIAGLSTPDEGRVVMEGEVRLRSSWEINPLESSERSASSSCVSPFKTRSSFSLLPISMISSCFTCK